jgi:hypothetical protein
MSGIGHIWRVPSRTFVGVEHDRRPVADGRRPS